MKTLSVNKISSAVLIVMMALAVLPVRAAYATGSITSTATGGAWNVGTTWVGGTVPTVDDSVVIATTGGDTVTLSAATTVKGSLTINSGAQLDTNDFALTLEGDFINNGVFDMTGGSAITIAGTANPQSIAGFTTSGTVSMTKTAGVATFTGNVIGGALTMNGLGGTLNLGSGLTHIFTGIWTRTAGTLEGGSSSVRLNGTVTGSNGVFTPGTGTFTYGGTAQNVAGGASVSYYRLKMQGTGVKTALDDVTVNENLSILSGSNFTIGAFNISVTGNTSITGTLTHSSPTGTKTYNGLVTVNSGGVWKNDAPGNADIHFHGGLTNNGTFSAGTGTYYFDTNDQAIGGSNAMTIPNLVVENGRTLTNNNSGGLTVSALLKGTGTPDINGYTGGILMQGATGILNIGVADANFTLTTLDASTIGNTVNYSYAGIQTVRVILYHNLTLRGSGAKTLALGLTHITGNLYLSGTASATTVDNLDVDGNLAIDQGASLTVGGFNFNVDGTTTITGTSSTINGKLTYGSASGAKTLIGLVTVGTNGIWDNTINVPIFFKGGLTFSGKTFTAGTGLYTFQNTVIQPIGGTIALAIPNVAIGAGVNLTNNNTAGLTVNTTLSGTGTLTQGAGGILNIGTTIANFTLSNLDASATGNTVNYSGSSQNVRAITYHHLMLSTSGAKDLAGFTTITGNLTLSGTASATTVANLNIGGNLTIGTGTLFTVGAFDITVTGATSVSGTLTHSSPTGTKTYNGPITINSGGVWNNSGDESITFHNGLAYSGSTFTAGTGVYTFDTNAAQTISGTISIPNLTVASSVTLTNNGTITVGTVLSGAGTWAQGTGGILNIGGTADITTLTASAAGNTVNYSGASPQTVIAIPYYHLGLSGGSVKTLPSGLTTINGNLTLSTTGTSATTAANLTIGGILNISSGTTLDVSASNFALNVAGNWTNAGTFTPRAGDVTLNGSSVQTISNGTSSFYNLILNNAAGATLSTDATVNNTLTLIAGKITTGAKTLIVGNGGSISGADSSKYIFGNLRKMFPALGSPQSFTFAIGDASAYTPVDLTIASVGTAGNITAKTTVGEHTNIATSGINPSKDINRSWTLTPAIIVFTTYDATFNFVAGDLDAGTTPASFIVKRYQSLAPIGWNSTTIGTRTSTSTQATGIPFTSATNVYSYAVGEADILASVTAVNSTKADGAYKAGELIPVTVIFNKVVNVVGVPTLTLETGAVDTAATYASGTGTASLTFNYTVQAGDTSGDLDYVVTTPLALNGGTIKDAAGVNAILTLTNPGDPGSLGANKAIVIDTTAPNTQINTKPANPTNSTSAAFTFSANETSTFACQMDAGGYGACASPYTLTAGPHTFDVRATDLAGNVSIPASYSWTIDTTAPSTQIDTKPVNPTNSTSAAFTFSADEASTFTCKMDGGNYGVCASPYTLAAGLHTFYARATDLAGNVDATPASYSWTIDTTAPTVLFSVRVNPALTTAQANVQFTVTFSEPVTGVDIADFSLTPAATVINAAITTVTPVSQTVYTVTVNTGSGNGTLRLDVPNTATIIDLVGNSLGGLPFTSGETYTINKTLTFQSTSTYDGWVLESTATSNKGGTFNAGATTFNLGDDAAKKQYRGILHFITASLPDDATITSATLKIMKSVGGKGSTSTLGALLADMTKPSFGAAALAKTDFEAVAGKPAIFNPFTILGNWYSATLKSTGFTYVNRTGTTQFRLRFTKGDDGDAVADYLLFYSGNLVTAANRPQLIIQYYVP